MPYIGSPVFENTLLLGDSVDRGDPLRERVLAELSRGLVERMGREPYLVRKEESTPRARARGGVNIRSGC